MPEFEQGRMWVGMGMVVGRMVGLCLEDGGSSKINGRGRIGRMSISAVSGMGGYGDDGHDDPGEVELKKDEKRRTWYCLLAWDRCVYKLPNRALTREFTF